MANPLQKLFDLGSGIFGSGAGDSVIGVDIGASSIKVVQLRKKGGKAVLETYGTLALGPYTGSAIGEIVNLPNDKLAQALTDVLREAGATTRNAGMSIPASAALVFIIELPALVPENQYGTVVPTEARKYIPVPINEVSLDFWQIPKKEELETPADGIQKNEVLVAAIHNDTITKYRDIVNQAQVNTSFFEIEVFSAIRANFGRELSSILLIDFGASRTKLAIIEYGVVRSFHIVSRGSRDITNALSKSLSIPFDKAEMMKRDFGLLGNPTDQSVHDIIKISTDYIFSETQSAVLNYEKKYNKTINKVILTGGGSLLKGFHDAAKGTFSAEVVMGNPFEKVEAPAFLDPVLAATGPEFGVALGIALRKLQS